MTWFSSCAEVGYLVFMSPEGFENSFPRKNNAKAWIRMGCFARKAQESNKISKKSQYMTENISGLDFLQKWVILVVMSPEGLETSVQWKVLQWQIRQKLESERDVLIEKQGEGKGDISKTWLKIYLVFILCWTGLFCVHVSHSLATDWCVSSGIIVWNAAEIRLRLHSYLLYGELSCDDESRPPAGVEARQYESTGLSYTGLLIKHDVPVRKITAVAWECALCLYTKNAVTLHQTCLMDRLDGVACVRGRTHPFVRRTSAECAAE